jgi:hypothetical protein
LGVCCRSCWPCRPPPEFDWADLSLLVLGLLHQRGVGRQAPQGRGLGQLDPLGQLGRLRLAGGVVLLDGGRVDHRVYHTTLGAVVGGLFRSLLRGKLVDGIPPDDRPVSCERLTGTSP